MYSVADNVDTNSFAKNSGVYSERRPRIRNDTSFPTPSPINVSSIHCNNCDAAILDEHYHWSTCADFDLCHICIWNYLQG